MAKAASVIVLLSLCFLIITTLPSSPATAAKEVTDTFKVDDPPPPSKVVTWANYKTFLERLRSKLAARYSHNRPVLANQGKADEPPSVWLTLVLKTKTASISLKLRGDNLYLIGYQMTKSTAWLEFKGTKHLIPKSTFLPFDGSYPQLAKYSPQNREELRLNQELLTEAVNKLAVTTNDRERALYLTVLIQMICEATRFISISDHITKNFRQKVPLTTQMIAQQNGWSVISAALLNADKTGNFSLPQPNKMGIVTAEQAVAVTGILLSAVPPKSTAVPENVVVGDDMDIQQWRFSQ